MKQVGVPVGSRQRRAAHRLHLAVCHVPRIAYLISLKLFLKSLCRSQVPPESVDLPPTITNLRGNGLLQNDFKSTLFEMIPVRSRQRRAAHRLHLAVCQVPAPQLDRHRAERWRDTGVFDP